MSKPITDPRREPPPNYVCCGCGETSDDYACMTSEYWQEPGCEPGEWVCGCCGTQEWRKPRKGEVAE